MRVRQTAGKADYANPGEAGVGFGLRSRQLERSRQLRTLTLGVDKLDGLGVSVKSEPQLQS